MSARPYRRSSHRVGRWSRRAVFQTQLPNRNTGACPSGTIPVYRLYNNRKDANHRYTTDSSEKGAMVARGYISEGYGTNGVAFCSPGPSITAASANFVVTRVTPDTFDFSSVVSPSPGATIVAYAWNFGDGSTGTGATTARRYTTSGTFPVVLTVTDSKNSVATASKLVTAAAPPRPLRHPRPLRRSRPLRRLRPLRRPTPTPTPPPTSTPTPAPSADFAARKSAPGVIRWFDSITQPIWVKSHRNGVSDLSGTGSNGAPNNRGIGRYIDSECQGERRVVVAANRVRRPRLFHSGVWRRNLVSQFHAGTERVPESYVRIGSNG